MMSKKTIIEVFKNIILKKRRKMPHVTLQVILRIYVLYIDRRVFIVRTL
jgi:hypothetical protein